MIIALAGGDRAEQNEAARFAVDLCKQLVRGGARHSTATWKPGEAAPESAVRIPSEDQEDLAMEIAYRLWAKAAMIRDSIVARNRSFGDERLATTAFVLDRAIAADALEVPDRVLVKYVRTMLGNFALDAQDKDADQVAATPPGDDGDPPRAREPAPPTSDRFDATVLRRVLERYVRDGRTDAARSDRRARCDELCRLSDRAIRAGLVNESVEMDELVRREAAGDTPNPGETEEAFHERVAARLYQRFCRVRKQLHEAARKLADLGEIPPEEAEDACSAIDGLLRRRRV